MYRILVSANQDDYTTTTSDTNANLNSVVKDTLNNNLTTTLAPTESWVFFSGFITL